MSYSNESVVNTKEPARYTNKLIKKTTDKKLRRILAVNQKNLMLANITMNDKRGQEEGKGKRHKIMAQLDVLRRYVSS